MSLKRKFLAGITSGLAVVALSSFVAAQDNSTTTQQPDGAQKTERKWGKRGGGEFGGKGFRRGGHRGGFGMHGLKQLNLTDAQKEQIRGIMESKRANREANQTQREEMRQIFEAKRSGTITAEQEARLKAMHDQRREEMRQTHEQILAILTPEQKAQLEQMKLERKQRREEFRQKRQQQRQNQTTTEKTPVS